MSRFEFKSGTFQFVLPLSSSMWRIVFAFLMVCRLHVRHRGQR
jgi:hypothetical protein